ncbi:MAG: hypothetical protein ACYTBV_15505, partial [Planctomycetota bacterium]
MKIRYFFAILIMVLALTASDSKGCFTPPPCSSLGDFDLVSPEDEHEYPSTTTSVTLDWDPSTNASYYYVYYGTDNPPTYHTTSITSTSYSINVQAGQTYYWKVAAENQSCIDPWHWCNQATGWSFSVASAGTVPDAPSNLSATATGSTQIDLSWADNSDDESGFRIKRSTNGTDYSEIDTVGANVESYSDMTANPSTLSYYKVCAYNANGDSTYAG